MMSVLILLLCYPRSNGLSHRNCYFTYSVVFYFVSIDIHNHELLCFLSREMERLEQEAKMKELEELRRKV